MTAPRKTLAKGRFLEGLSSGLVCVYFLFSSCPPATAKQPNIIVILVDDMGYSDLGCYGSTISTPNIDQLAAQGVRFRQAYNSAKCEPTRACLISGQWWQDVGYGIQHGPTIGNVMQSAGYRTLALDKWHLEGNPVDRGFDRYFGQLSGASDFFLGNDTYRLHGKKFMVPLLTGGGAGERGALYFHLFDHRAVILNGYKLLSDWGRPWGLYDLAADRFETKDLSKEMPEKTEALAALWDRWSMAHAVNLKGEGGEPKYLRRNPKG